MAEIFLENVKKDKHLSKEDELVLSDITEKGESGFNWRDELIEHFWSDESWFAMPFLDGKFHALMNEIRIILERTCIFNNLTTLNCCCFSINATDVVNLRQILMSHKNVKDMRIYFRVCSVPMFMSCVDGGTLNQITIRSTRTNLLTGRGYYLFREKDHVKGACDELATLSFIDGVMLDDCEIDILCMKSLMTKPLKSLSLSNINDKHANFFDKIKEIPNMNCGLRSFSYTLNNHCFEMANKVVEFLKTQPFIRSVNVSGCNMAGEDIRKLSSYLKSNGSIVEFVTKNNGETSIPVSN